jgi:hypothetical protein
VAALHSHRHAKASNKANRLIPICLSKRVKNNGMNLLAGGGRTQSFSLNPFPLRFITLPYTHSIIADRDALKVDKK